MMRRLWSLVRPFRKDERGLASIEFALFFPVYLGLFLWAVELGIVMMKATMLEHAMDVAMRDMRLGLVPNPSQAQLKADICARASIIGDCEDQMMIQLEPVSTQTWAMPNTPVTCVNNDEDIQPVVTFDPGRQQELMLVRACIMIPVLFPEMALGRRLFTDGSGRIGIAATSAFVNEPA